MGGEPVGQFGFAGAAKVLPQFGPRLQAGALDDPLKLGPQILRAVTVSRDAEFGSRLSLLEGFAQVRQKLRKDGNLPRFVANVMFGLGAGDDKSFIAPVNVLPPQPQGLRRNPQTPVACQGEQQPPFSIGVRVKDGLSLFTVDVVKAFRVGSIPPI